MTDLPQEWFPCHENGVITPLAQAVLYPYPAPDCDFFMDRGEVRLMPEGIRAEALMGRVAVLSVGSNRAPLQLRRKFGEAASLPITRAIAHNLDIVFAASLAPYGAIPATAFPSEGAEVAVNIAWLDADQLAIMHRSEGVGVSEVGGEGVGEGYNFIRYHRGVISHGARDDGTAPIFAEPIYGYEAKSGVLRGFLGDTTPIATPIAHADISAEGRIFPERNEQFMLEALWRRMERVGLEEGGAMPYADKGCADGGCADGGCADGGFAAWIFAMQGSKAMRKSVLAYLGQHAHHPESPPWDHLPELQH